MSDELAMVRAAQAKWKPFAPVADIAFDDAGEIFMAGFAEGVLWARSRAEATSKDQP